MVALGEGQLGLHLLPELHEPRCAHARRGGRQHPARLRQVAPGGERGDAVDIGQRRGDRAALGRRPREALHLGEAPAVVDRRLQGDVQRLGTVELTRRPRGRRGLAGADLQDVAHRVRAPAHARGGRQRQRQLEVARSVQRPRRPRGDVGRILHKPVELAGGTNGIDHDGDVLLAPAHQERPDLEPAQGAASGQDRVAQPGAPGQQAVPVAAGHQPGRRGHHGVGRLVGRAGVQQALHRLLMQAVGRQRPAVPAQQHRDLLGVLTAQSLQQVLAKTRVIPQPVGFMHARELGGGELREPGGAVAAAEQRIQALG